MTHLIDDDYLRQNRLLAGDLSAPVALCALWKDLTKVTFDDAARAQLALTGNLYTLRGVSYLLRGLWRLPSLRYVIIWGPDTQHTGDALLSLWANGLNGDHAITGMVAELDAALPVEAIEHLRQHVTLHDLRKERALEPVVALAESLDRLPPHGDPQIFPETEQALPETLPSLVSGFQVSAERVADAWPVILDRLLRFGVVKDSQYEIAQRELLNMTVVVSDEDPAAPHLPDYLPLTADSLAEYTPSVTTAQPPDGVSYTYGHRLRGYFGVDQIEVMAKKLSAAPHTRRATAVTWDPRTDPSLDTPPCLTQVVTNVVNDRLYLSYVARSQDMYAAWPQNTLAMRQLQAELAGRLEIGLGPITSLTVSAHIYSHDWEPAEGVVRQREKALRTLRLDPQGNVIIRLDGGNIVVEWLDVGGQQILWHTSGKTAYDIGNEIAALGLASLPAHYVYIGRELQRAEEALRRGEAYDQGMA